MGRLLPFLELAIAACVAVFFSLRGTLSVSLAILPIVVVLLVPVAAAIGVWPSRVLLRALRDGWGSDPLRKPEASSPRVWQFLECMAPRAGAVGAAVFAMLALQSFSDGLGGDGATDLTRRLASMVGLCGADAALAFFVFRAVRHTVEMIERRLEGRTRLPDAALDRYAISEREEEVALLLLAGLRYSEIADQLFISVKTVKTHVHRLYQKTGTRNRMEFAICLRA
jgi:DNA-binding CsgD family transcriptional regulator